VHPSWRDLVIEELSHDIGARQGFLRACAADGAALALSHAGGTAGERALPLLATDSDWDVLGDRLHELMRELEDQDLARVLLALAEALAVVNDRAQHPEAQSLATYLLRTTAQTWAQQRRPLSVFLLDAWYSLNAYAVKQATPPPLAATWAELRPGSQLLQNADGSELARADEWLALAQLIRERDPGALDTLGFYYLPDQVLLEGLIVTLTGVAVDDEQLRPVAESILSRVEELVPSLAASARSAIEIGQLAEGGARNRWWVPEDLPAPPSTETVAASTRDFQPADVYRVLNDL
jgi:hypothetical protein